MKRNDRLNRAVEVAQTVRRSAERFGNKQLAGICSACSLALAVALQSEGIQAEIVSGSYGGQYSGSFHVWVEVDGTIIDVTATQFRKNLRSVTLRKSGHPMYFERERTGDTSGFLFRMHPVPRSVFLDMSGVKYRISDLLTSDQEEAS